ncbi:MAG: Maf family protein [Polyangiaceae bacterium]
MIRADRPLLLGSGSPRRRQILAELGIPITVASGSIDESPGVGEPVEAFLERIVREKLASVVPRAESMAVAGILVADTIVVVDGEILGKPVDQADACRLLARIVGRTHTVFTRYGISRAPAFAELACARTVETEVSMRRVSDEEVRAYAATGEGLDKAGAYAAQGIGTFLIQRIAGSYTNVVGLPAAEVILDLVALGLLARFP